MARRFVDTAALVSLYRAEATTAAVQACIAEEDELLISEITTLEFTSACLTWVRMKLVDDTTARARISDFLADLHDYLQVPIHNSTYVRALVLVDKHAASTSLRPLDAIQLACALEEHKRSPIDTFVTTDSVLAVVARAEGLNVLP